MEKYPKRKFVEIDLFRQVANECCEYQRRYETIQNLTDSLSIKLIRICRGVHHNIKDVDDVILACNEFIEKLSDFYQSCKDWEKSQGRNNYENY